MAHFAQLDENNKVIQIIVVSNDDCENLPFPESEPVGQAFIASLGLGNNWKQSSYNGNFRRFAGVGATYLEEHDIFIYPQPYESWILNTDHEWEAPIPKPSEDGFWVWDESEQVWKR